jgi:LacI family transcriptional regulator
MSMDIPKDLRPERVTIRTVAADAGVSVAAVSKVMRNAYGVSDALRLNVTASIERLGYRPSVAARGMRGQTYTIGILLVDIANPFLPEVIDGINDVLDPSNYKAMVGIGLENVPLESKLIEQMIDYRMDGLILVAPRMLGATMAKFARQIPIVAIGHHEATADSFDTVNSDDEKGAALVVQSLVASGYKDIAMIGAYQVNENEATVDLKRQAGYIDAMAKAGLSDFSRVIRLPYAKNIRDEAVRTILTMPNRPRAMFCWSDLDAIPMINVARTMGLRVPEDLAIVGYDDSRIAALPLIGLTSINQSGRRMGALSAETLLSRIAGRTAPNHFLIDPSLTSRTSD